MARRTADARTREQLIEEIESLRSRLAEAEETLEAIRTGAVDAVVVAGEQGEQVFTLSGAEHVYRTIVETMSEAAITTTSDGTVLFANRGFSEMVHLPLNEIIGRPFADFVTRPFRRGIRQFLERARKGPARKRIVLKRDGGAEAPVYAATSRLDDSGTVNICVVLTDLTEIEAADRLLHQARELLKNAVNAAPIVLMVTDTEGVVTLAEGRGLGAVGISAHDRLGRSIHEVYGDSPELLSAWERALKGEEAGAVVVTGLGRDFDTRCVPVRGLSGAVTEVVCVSVDVTERTDAEKALHRSEEMYRRIVETAGEGIWMLGGNLRTTFVNEHMAAMLGYAPEEMIGRPPWAFTDSRWAAVGRARLRPSHGKGLEQFDFKLLRKDGESLWATVLSSPINEESGRTGVLWMVADITERRSLEAQVLREAEGERRRIGQDLHDTLGQSFAALTLLSKLLAQKLSEREAAEAVDALHIAGVAKDAAVAMRRISRGLAPIGVTPEGLMEALSEMASDVSRTHGIECKLTYDKPLLIADPAMAEHLYLIIREAINNAIKHGRASKVDISVVHDGGEAAIRILDNGVGLPEDMPGGKGMGLRTMQYRAGIIGASVEVAAGPSGGTVVTCRLQVAEEDAAAQK